MDESAVFNESDLAPFHRRLAELRQIVQQDAAAGKHPDALTKLLERQLNECGQFSLLLDHDYNSCLDALVKNLQESLAVLSAELIPIHERLVTLRRQLVALAAKGESQKSALKPLQEELRKIDSLSTSFIHRRSL
jgi:chromosome segregation ATPase